MQARELARQTPEARNRFVDFMRAISILLVIIGHWLIAVHTIKDGELVPAHLLSLAPWSHWLTWVFQVMPVFFIVGGYANAASWESAKRQGHPFEQWIAVRLRRLVCPIVPLLIVWSVAAIVAPSLEINPQLFQKVSRTALNPLWFLAVYLMIVLMTPLTHELWQRYGLKAFAGFAMAAMAVDVIAFSAGLPLMRWMNFGFVWLAICQLGYVWRGRKIRRPAHALWWAATGLCTLIFLVAFASYPISMISVPGIEISNSRPPTIALLALAVTQFGLLLAVERPARSWLRRSAPWTATVWMNGTIMSFFLWHLTALQLVVSLSYTLGGYGLNLQALSLAWWISRPLWIAGLFIVLVVLVTVFAVFEFKAKAGYVRPLPIWQATLGTVLLCNGLALLARKGIGGEGPICLQLFVLLLALIGGALVIGRSMGPRGDVGA